MAAKREGRMPRLERHDAVAAEVREEVHRQHAKWGSDRAELPPVVWVTVLTEEVGEVAKDALEQPNDTTAMEQELIQVAAVAQEAIVNLRRRRRP